MFFFFLIEQKVSKWPSANPECGSTCEPLTKRRFSQVGVVASIFNMFLGDGGQLPYKTQHTEYAAKRGEEEVPEQAFICIL